MTIIINNMWHFWCTLHYEHLEGTSLPTIEKNCTVIQSIKRTRYKNKYLWFSHSNLMQVPHCHFPPYTMLLKNSFVSQKIKKKGISERLHSDGIPPLHMSFVLENRVKSQSWKFYWSIYLPEPHDLLAIPRIMTINSVPLPVC